MNRDIKFRVWDSISKAYHYWGNIQNNKFNDFDLDHYTLEQYTGLKDSKGVDIYEGDIVAHFSVMDFIDGELVENRQYNISTVFYKNGGFCLHEEDEILMGLWMDAEDVDFEVIGNIYENTELLT